MEMGRGRSAAGAAVLLGVLLLCAGARSDLLVVGDNAGWGWPNVSHWSDGKTFRAGVDRLIFKYDKTQHNVVVAGRDAYNLCLVVPGSKVYDDGLDVLPLPKGYSYFFSSLNGDCRANVKLGILAV